jgi:hypothetical protein
MVDSTLERFVKQLWNIVAHPCLWLSSILVDPGVTLLMLKLFQTHFFVASYAVLFIVSAAVCMRKKLLQMWWHAAIIFWFCSLMSAIWMLDVFCSLMRWAVQYMSYQGATINHGHPTWVWIWTTTHLVGSTEAQGRRDIKGVKYMRLYTCHDTCITLI